MSFVYSDSLLPEHTHKTWHKKSGLQNTYFHFQIKKEMLLYLVYFDPLTIFAWQCMVRPVDFARETIPKALKSQNEVFVYPEMCSKLGNDTFISKL